MQWGPMADVKEQQVTAVGRLLQSKGGAPRRHVVLAVRPDGTARRVVDRELPG